MENQTIKLTLSRKRMLSAAFRSFDIYVNGEFIGKLKNGKTLTAQIAKRSDYIFDIDLPFDVPCVLSDCDEDELDIRLDIIGGFGYPLEPTLLTKRSEQYHPLEDLSSSWERLTAESELDFLDEPRRVLGLCLLFWYTVSDAASLLFCHPRLNEMADALRTVGANGYADLIAQITESELGDLPLPLSREQILSDKTLAQKLRTIDTTVWEAEKNHNLSKEFHRAVVQHVLTHHLFGV